MTPAKADVSTLYRLDHAELARLSIAWVHELTITARCAFDDQNTDAARQVNEIIHRLASIALDAQNAADASTLARRLEAQIPDAADSDPGPGVDVIHHAYHRAADRLGLLLRTVA